MLPGIVETARAGLTKPAHSHGSPYSVGLVLRARRRRRRDLRNRPTYGVGGDGYRYGCTGLSVIVSEGSTDLSSGKIFDCRSIAHRKR
jgi:hypothetical protein